LSQTIWISRTSTESYVIVNNNCNTILLFDSHVSPELEESPVLVVVLGILAEIFICAELKIFIFFMIKLPPGLKY